MRAALYGRISTTAHRQDTENQMVLLREYCTRQGYTITAEYIDEMSGAKAGRPRFQQMLQEARHRHFDIVLFWALDRFSREGVLETLTYLKELSSWGVDWRSYSEQYLDSTGIFKDAIIAILAAIAKQERVRIRERVNAGIARARRDGVKFGAPKKIFDREKAKEMLKSSTVRKVAAAFGVSKSTIGNL